VAKHPQVEARGALVDLDHPKAGKVRMVGPVPRLSATPPPKFVPAPTLGQHTAEVLRDVLGMSADEIAALAASGVVAAGRK